MNIKQKFLDLTSRTYPHGTESEVYELLGIEKELRKDNFGNLSIQISDSDTMFTSHLDTATKDLSSVNHVIADNIIKTDGKTILGADDKAGVTIMLYMIENKVPGLYYFFLGEEVGCLGSKKVAESHKKNKLNHINKVVSFDRRDTSSVITYQSSRRCASDEFGDALSKEFNKADSSFKYEKDDTGVLTDSVQFTKIYPECTNISVGYYKEHTHRESQDIKHLEKLAVACTKVDWNSLPVKRDPSKVEYKNYNPFYRGQCYNSYEDFDDYYNDEYYLEQKKYRKKSKRERIWFHDKDNNYVSSADIDEKTGKYLDLDIHQERVRSEKVILNDFFQSIDLVYQSIEWNGINGKIKYNNSGHIGNFDRNELIDFIEELDIKNM